MAADAVQVPDFGTAEFKAAVLEFVAEVRAGTATDSPQSYAYATWLAGAFEAALTGQAAAVLGISHDEAEAWFEQMLADQRALYGSLAAHSS